MSEDHPNPMAVQGMIGRTILYVEDHPASRFLMGRIVARRPDLEMIFADTAELGLEIAVSVKPDLILMDINLPGMNGFQALEQLQLNEMTRDIPVIALSANVKPSDAETGQAGKFTDYLTKPVNIKVVLDTITATLSGNS